MSNTISQGQISHDGPARTPGVGRHFSEVASAGENAGEGPQTTDGATQAAAIVSKRLARLSQADTSSAQEDARVDADINSKARLISGQIAAQAQRVDVNTVVQELQAQFRSNMEVAVLAQANQMPSAVMPFSASEGS
jgi:uncharacterized hydantoinase/oxoprolinase family protein